MVSHFISFIADLCCIPEQFSTAIWKYQWSPESDKLIKGDLLKVLIFKVSRIARKQSRNLAKYVLVSGVHLAGNKINIKQNPAYSILITATSEVITHTHTLDYLDTIIPILFFHLTMDMLYINVVG